MKYSYEFKIKCVEAYKTGRQIEVPKGRKNKRKSMKKNNKQPKPLTPSEKEEFIRTKAELEYYKAEVAALKKERALRLERWDAALKAKKQKSSKNSGNKER